MDQFTVSILVIESEPDLCSLIVSSLQRDGFSVRTAKSGEEARTKIRTVCPDFITMELDLPDMDGLQLLRQIRLKYTVPVLVLTARSDIDTKVKAFESGADDFLAKPFDTRELTARIAAILRRCGEPKKQNPLQSSAAQIVQLPDLEVNLSNYQVYFKGKAADLSPREIELLYFLASHPNQVFSREQLLDQVWGSEYDGDSRTIDTHIRKIRKKITGGPGWSIQTVWGVGYKFETEEATV